MKILILKIFIFFINIFFLNKFFYLLFSICIFESKKYFNRIEEYLDLCNSFKLLYKKKFLKIINPKVSIISPVFNRGKYILRFLRSIQNQRFKDIEIIFIDDNSKDDSVKIISNYQKEEKKIILIKNKKNIGTFKCRNLGVLRSKGQYIILPDPDDILSKNVLKICYNFSIKLNIEMIRFNIYIGRKSIFHNEIVNGLESRVIYQPELSTYLYYAKGKLQLIDFNLSNKFIKREPYIKTLNLLEKYLNIYMITYEDGLINSFLYRNVKSFYFLKIIGYYYIRNKQSITMNRNRGEKILKYVFIYLKIIFEYTKNTICEKNMAKYLFILKFYIKKSF